MEWDEGTDGTGVCGWGTWTCSFPWEKLGLEVGARGAGAHLKTRWPSCSPRLIKSLLWLASLTCQGNMGSLGSRTAALRPRGLQPQPFSLYQEVSFQPQKPQDPQVDVHSPHPARAGGHWLYWSEPRILWSQVLQAGWEEGAVGEGSLCLRLLLTMPGPESTNSHLTS